MARLEPDVSGPDHVWKHTYQMEKFVKYTANIICKVWQLWSRVQGRVGGIARQMQDMS